MSITLMILLTAGMVGAVDVLYFHIWKFRLYSRPQSVKEEITHLFRALIYPLGLGLLLLGWPKGGWFWVVGALFALDLLNNLIDGRFEPSSRVPLVVPATELMTHYAGTTLFGAAWATFMLMGWSGRLEPTALQPYPEGALPNLVYWSGLLSLTGALILFLLESTLFVRAVLKSGCIKMALLLRKS
jgi:hypothetical protein